jgi:heat shock protein HtpX
MAFVLIAYFVGLFLLANLAGALLNVGSVPIYLVFVLAFITLLNLGGAAMFQSRLRVKWISEEESPRLHEITSRLAQKAGLTEPQVGTSRLDAANAFAFGRTRRDGKVCISEKLLNQVSDDELTAVIALEVSHIRSWDMTIISLLAVVPVMSQAILQIPERLVAVTGWLGARVLLILLAVVVQPVVWLVWLALIPVNWFSTVLVNYASRVRELTADREAVRLGVSPHHLASALFKIATSDVDWKQAYQLKSARPLFLGRHFETYGERVFLSRLDVDHSGDISEIELAVLRDLPSRVTLQERVAEVFSAHPILRERFGRLSRLA